MSEEHRTQAWEDDDDVMLDRPDPTGLPRVEAVVDAVVDIGSVPLEGHVAVYEQAHRELRAVLDDPDAAAADVEPA